MSGRDFAHSMIASVSMRSIHGLLQRVRAPTAPAHTHTAFPPHSSAPHTAQLPSLPGRQSLPRCRH